MTDEEMAEEYADRTRIVDENTRAGTDCISLVQDYEGNYIDIHERIKQAFLAGLKAGRPQWHDLRKDPNDLPEEPTEKMKVNETWAYVKFFDNTYGLVDKGALKNYKGAISWCELPTFDKE